MIRLPSTIALAAILILSVSGCTTYSLQKLRKSEAQGNAFQKELAKQYLAFSESEAKQYDWYSSKHFADKGLTAAYGNDVDPDSVGQWKIPKALRPEMEKARETLMQAYGSGAKSSKPELAAKAQYYYDCWLEQQEENWQTEDIEACKQSFYNTVSQLGGDMPVAEPAPQPQAETKAPPAEEPLILSTSYIVFFEWNKAELTEEGRKVIADVEKDLKHEKDPYDIVLNGHADRSGTDEYNLKLSEARVEAVRAELVAAGIPDKQINVYAFGETDNRVPTDDGVREKANRRVEIFLNQDEGKGKE